MKLAHCRAVPASSNGEALLGEPAVVSPAEADVPAEALDVRWRELAQRSREHALTREGAAEAERQVSFRKTVVS